MCAADLACVADASAKLIRRSPVSRGKALIMLALTKVHFGKLAAGGPNTAVRVSAAVAAMPMLVGITLPTSCGLVELS
jgi:hypothetical protein